MVNFEEWLPKIQAFSIEYGVLLLKTVAIFIIGRIVAKVLRNGSDRIMKRGGQGWYQHALPAARRAHL